MALDIFSQEVKVTLEHLRNPKNLIVTHKEVHSLWRQTTTNVWSSYQTQTIAPQSSFPEAVALPPSKNVEAPPPLS